jgi:urease accessory protein
MVKLRPRPWPIWPALLALLLLPGRAEAHLISTGMGPVYDGIGHFFLSPEDILPAILVSLMAGQRGPRPGRWTLVFLPGAWVVAGLVGLHCGSLVMSQPKLSAMIAATFFIPGVLVASDLRLPEAVVAAVVIALGLVHGFFDGMTSIQEGLSVHDGVLAFIGVAVVLFVIATLATAGVISLRWYWTRIAVRVAGSWMAAIGFLLFGWCLVGVG